jgi:hypothetical protein
MRDDRRNDQPLTTRPRVASARQAGFEAVGRANRWMISVAVILAGGVSLVAAHAFHTHAAGAAQQSRTGSHAPATGQQSGDDGSSAPLQSPSQAPSTAPAAPAPVVSGGS